MARTLVGVGLALGLLAACSAEPTPMPTVATSAPATPTSSVTPAETATSAVPTPTPTASAPTAPQVLAGNLDVPWDLAVLPDGSALVTLRDEAQVVRIADTGSTVVARIDQVRPSGEAGLLGIALSPTFATDSLVYLYYTGASDNRVVRYRWTGSGLDQAAPIVTGIPKASTHNGGRLRFGPDGMLYIGTGDAQTGSRSQDKASLGGKILRVAPDGSVPAGNPFGTLVWSYGHRNVQGMGWSADGTMYASEFGNSKLDELNVITPGGNYGWPLSEGPDSDPSTVDPLVTWPTSDASPSGIAVMPDATVYVAGLRGERLWKVSGTSATVVLTGYGRLRDVQHVGDALWILTNNTARGTPGADDDRLVAIPIP